MKIRHMTPGEWIGWTLAYLRFKGDQYLVERHGMARIYIAGLTLALLLPPALRIDAYLAPKPQVINGLVVQHAWIQIVVYLVIMIVAAIIAYALAPKPPTPEPGKSTVPEARDGKSIIRAYGDVWVEDPMMLGFKAMGADPIKKKGGK